MVKKLPDNPQDIQSREFCAVSNGGGVRTQAACRFRSVYGPQRLNWPRGHGVFHTARALRLEYGKLKRLWESASLAAKSRRTKGRKGGRRGGARSLAPPAAFVELMTTPTAGLSESLIELEGRRGKMRIQWKGTSAPDLGALSRALWESQ